MSVGLVFSLCSLFYIALIAVVYHCKKKILTAETKIYSVLVNTCVVGISIELLSTFLHMYIDGYDLLKDISLKLIVIFFFTWLFVFTIYICLISNKDLSKIYSKYAPKLYFLIFLVMLFLPIYKKIQDGMVVYTYGPCVNLLYLIFVVLITVCTIMFIKYRKNINQKKMIPLYTFFVIGIIMVIVQSFFPDLLLLSSVDAFITILMYFTIENPDVKMLEEVELARETADKANQAKTDFLSSMSHEIRTPLNAIVGFSQNLYEEDIPDSSREQVQDIVTASNNLLEIVNGILDISKIEANKLEIINEEYSFKKVFNELVALGNARLGDKQLLFKAHYDETIPKVLYGDRLRVKQVILNILTNSIKYTKNGFIEFKVNSIIKDNVCRLIISVEDSGIGIKKENIDKLFTKFQRFEEKNTTIEGTGLGLAITKKLVELMNGQIIVQSIYGKGSKFTIAIDQMIINNPVSLEKENKCLNSFNEVVDLSGKKVLVVDDNKLNLKVASKLLGKYNLTLELITSGYECLEKIKFGEKYDLVLLDDMMPRMSGVDTLIELKKIEGYNIPTVILTANAIAGMREKYINDGFDDYLAKPIEKDELNRVLKEFIAKE